MSFEAKIYNRKSDRFRPKAVEARAKPIDFDTISSALNTRKTGRHQYVNTAPGVIFPASPLNGSIFLLDFMTFDHSRPLPQGSGLIASFTAPKHGASDNLVTQARRASHEFESYFTEQLNTDAKRLVKSLLEDPRARQVVGSLMALSDLQPEATWRNFVPLKIDMADVSPDQRYAPHSLKLQQYFGATNSQYWSLLEVMDTLEHISNVLPTETKKSLFSVEKLAGRDSYQPKVFEVRFGRDMGTLMSDTYGFNSRSKDLAESYLASVAIDIEAGCRLEVSHANPTSLLFIDFLAEKMGRKSGLPFSTVKAAFEKVAKKDPEFDKLGGFETAWKNAEYQKLIVPLEKNERIFKLTTLGQIVAIKE